MTVKYYYCLLSLNNFFYSWIIHRNEQKKKAGKSHRADTRQFKKLKKNELLFVAQLQNKELNKCPYLRQQSERVEDNVNITEYIKKIMLIKESFDGRFSDFF